METLSHLTKETAWVAQAPSLEAQFHAQVNPARSAAAEERIADGYIRSCTQRVVSSTGAVRIYAILRAIRNERRQFGIREIGMIEQVVDLCPELQGHLLGERGFL